MNANGMPSSDITSGVLRRAAVGVPRRKQEVALPFADGLISRPYDDAALTPLQAVQQNTKRSRRRSFTA